ncbi:MAG: uncharacterized protein A8A55_2482 [Amphiamblys sp. WSBS2006]|nr:MAG: uncharacterized protein A8A55_2482 [Amphiamblys sp. WSBS2006]
MDKTTKLLESTPIDKWQAAYKIPHQKQNKKVIDHIVLDVHEGALKNIPDSQRAEAVEIQTEAKAAQPAGQGETTRDEERLREGEHDTRTQHLLQTDERRRRSNRLWTPLRRNDATRHIDNRGVFSQALRTLPDWKPPGRTQVYGFWIKKIEPLHRLFCHELSRIIKGEQEAPAWYYTGTTIMVSKKEETENAAEHRPITYMPVMYKLASKVVMLELTALIEANHVLSRNHLGATRRTQNAKEQALINKAINTEKKDSVAGREESVRLSQPPLHLAPAAETPNPTDIQEVHRKGDEQLEHTHQALEKDLRRNKTN